MSLFSRFLLISTFALAGIPRVLLGQQWPAPTTFGSVAVGSSSQQTVTFNNVPAGTSFSVYTGTDFTIGSPNCVGSTCTVQTTFQPHYPGLRQGAITASNQNQLYAVAFLSGIGTAPQIALGPGVISSVASPATYQLSSATLNGVVVADGGYVFVSDSANDIVYAIRTTDGRVLAIAGRGGAGYSGDGASAVNAQLNAPSALALDALGDLYIADTGNNVIRKVDGFSGNISTVAGSGVAGNGGDGGAANQAQLNGPQGLAVDAQGNLYISDTGNNRVREVLANNGQITGSNTIVAKAGTGVAGFSGDGGPAVSAKLNQPRGIALDANGNLFIADLGNAVIREETPISGNAIFTVAGTGQSTGWSPDGTSATSALLDNPIAVAVDAAGDIYIADENNQLVREVTNDAGRPIYTIAGSVFSSGYAGDGGLATSAKLAAPSVVALDSADNVFVVDFANRALREISARSSAITFPPTQSGNTSGPLTERVSNTGNATLSISSIAAASPYSVSGGTCGSSINLAAGASCTVGLSFSPSSSATPPPTNLALTDNSLNAAGAQQAVALNESAGLRFVAVTPCRVVDTRFGGFSGTRFTARATRSYTLPSAPTCSIPSAAAAYALNVAVVPQGPLTFLTMWPNGQSQPVAATLNSADGRIKSVASIVGADTSGAISVYASDSTDLVLDVEGYFVASGAANYSNDLEFYPVTPCRVVDTRNANGALGGPAFTAHTKRDFPIQSSSCNIPSNAAAYSLNIVGLPAGGALSFLTAWPTGQTQPTAAVLNAPTGAITANAAIIQAGGSGDISVYSTDAANVVIDINGYFAAPGSNGLSLYPVTPCRVLDTRPSVFSGTSSTSFTTSSCSVPAVAQAYVVNATVLPNNQPLEFLTLWQQGSGLPIDATLNAYDGVITNNMAIVPTTNGSISEYATSSTNLVLDIFGYFAP